MNEEDLQTITERSTATEGSGGSGGSLAETQKKAESLLNNQEYQKQIEVYECYYDKCELMLIAAQKLEESKELKLTRE